MLAQSLPLLQSLSMLDTLVCIEPSICLGAMCSTHTLAEILSNCCRAAHCTHTLARQLPILPKGKGPAACFQPGMSRTTPRSIMTRCLAGFFFPEVLPNSSSGLPILAASPLSSLPDVEASSSLSARPSATYHLYVVKDEYHTEQYAAWAEMMTPPD